MSNTVPDDEDNEDDVPESLRDTEEYQQLKTLTRLRQHMANHQSAARNIDQAVFQNNDRSIVDNIDLQSAVNNNVRSLVGQAVASQQSHIDWDYTSRSTGVSSYLDPNYLPAL